MTRNIQPKIIRSNIIISNKSKKDSKKRNFVYIYRVLLVSDSFDSLRKNVYSELMKVFK